jgi:acetoin utilization protein AcuB
MKVRDWMSPDPVTVSPDTTVAEARVLMDAEGFRHLPVVSGGTVIGIVSDRDVAIKDVALRAALRQRNIEDLLDDDRPVEAVMAHATLHVIGPDATVSEAARLLVSRRISALPVIDGDRKLVGIITSVDCLLASLEQHTDDTDGPPA